MALPNRTIVRKITIGTPISRVIGNSASSLDDLLDVRIDGIQDGDVLQYNSAISKFENKPLLTGGTF
tara:strand:+ start:1182 stop:1382 length:201 start_codon:yes stop_codon:yes gene_type:complete